MTWKDDLERAFCTRYNPKGRSGVQEDVKPLDNTTCSCVSPSNSGEVVTCNCNVPQKLTELDFEDTNKDCWTQCTTEGL